MEKKEKNTWQMLRDVEFGNDFSHMNQRNSNKIKNRLTGLHENVKNNDESERDEWKS